MQRLSNKFLRIFLIFLFLNNGISRSGFAQYHNNSDSSSHKNAQTVQPTQQGLLIQPVVRLGVGELSYIGNIKSSSSNVQSPSNGRIGYDIGISQSLLPSLEFSLNFLYGSVAETEHSTSAYWNFQSSIVGGGLNLLYRILPKQNVSPYFIIGAESYEFQSRADIYDQSGNEYYSWSDGSLRSLPQTSPEAASAKILNPDYAYATDIRKVNAGGDATYLQQTFAIPIGAGFMFHIAPKADFMLGTTLHYTFTQHIDGLTPQVQGPLKNDMFLYTYATLRVNLTRSQPKSSRFFDPAFDASLLEDTVHPDVPRNMDTSDLALQMQYDRYHDTTGKFSKLIVDSFHWHGRDWIGVGAMPSNNNQVAINNSATPIAAATTTPINNGGVPNNNGTNSDNTTNSEGIVYKVQLLSAKTKLAEGITFAGITDKASVDEENGLYKYSTGHFGQYSDAVKYLNELRAKGYGDAFIKATKNGKTVPMSAHKGEVSAAIVSVSSSEAKSGLVFKLQFGAFSALPSQAFMATFKNFSNTSTVKDNAGITHYLAGSYSNLNAAVAARDKAKTEGAKDVFVKALYNGQFISLQDAANLPKK